jgi:hypothetical protein
MSPAELGGRVAISVRREASRVGWAARKSAWRREDLARLLALDDPLVRDAASDLGAGAIADAQARLARHLLTRPRRWPIAPRDRESLASAIRARFPAAAADARRRADRIVAGRFDLLGYRGLPADAGDGVDWHRDPVHGRTAPRLFWSQVPFLTDACGDHKIVWELNRHQHWLALGRAAWLAGAPRDRDTCLRHLAGWMAANPPLVGINWASMLELGLRSISWIWALHFFTTAGDALPDPPAGAAEPGPQPWIVDLLLGLDRQLRLIEANLSTWFSPNTHLIGEALALYVAGRALPELRRSATWARTGRRVLIEEIARQIGADGGHVERSFHYHRYTLDFYLLALVVARLTGDDTAPFAEAVERLARFARVAADDQGRLARIGDDDGGALFPICGRDVADASDSLALAARLLGRPSLAVGPSPEEVWWMAGDDARDRAGEAPGGDPPSSTALDATGYVVCRTRRGDHLVFDVGRHGFLNGGHAHADALAVTLTVAGRPLFVDPGTACYTIDPERRDRFRSTRLHNTVMFDDRPSSEPQGPFHWATTADATRLTWRTTPELDEAAAAHDGFAPARHVRSITARAGWWQVRDRVEGAGDHAATLHWHLDPAWTAAVVEPGLVRVRHRDGARIWIRCAPAPIEVIRGGLDDAELGWVSPVYGRIEPSTTLRVRVAAGLPITIVTIVTDSSAPPPEPEFSDSDG